MVFEENNQNTEETKTAVENTAELDFDDEINGLSDTLIVPEGANLEAIEKVKKQKSTIESLKLKYAKLKQENAQILESYRRMINNPSEFILNHPEHRANAKLDKKITTAYDNIKKENIDPFNEILYNFIDEKNKVKKEKDKSN